MGYAALGVALGALLRSPGLATGVGLAWILPAQTILVAAWDSASRLLPGALLSALAEGGTSDVTLASAAAGTTAWVAGLTAVAWAVFSRRDVAG